MRIVETLALIDAPPTGARQGFYAGLVLWDGEVVEAADIIKYMRRWSRDRVRSYCQQRGWRVSVVHELVRDKP